MEWLIQFAFKVLSALYWATPLQLRVLSGKALGRILFSLRVRRSVVRDNLIHSYPEWSQAEQKRIMKAIYENQGQTAFEYLYFPKLSAFRNKINESIFSASGVSELDAILKKGRGGVLLTMHLGNGDLALALLAQRGYPISLVTRSASVQWVNNIWFRFRRDAGVELIPARHSFFAILRALKRNRLVVFALDQYLGPPHGVETEFFGRKTGTTMGLALLLARSKVSVIPCYTYRELGRHQLVFEKPMSVEPGNQDEWQWVQRQTQAYTSWIESVVRKHPEQWMWLHRRWKRFKGTSVKEKAPSILPVHRDGVQNEKISE